MKTTMLILFSAALLACGRIPGDAKFQSDLDDEGVALDLDASLTFHAACTSWQISRNELTDCQTWAEITDLKAVSLDPDLLTVGDVASVPHARLFSIAAHGVKEGSARLQLSWVEDGKAGTLTKTVEVAKAARVEVTVEAGDGIEYRPGYAVLANTKLTASRPTLFGTDGVRLTGTTDLRVDGADATAGAQVELARSSHGLVRVFAAAAPLAQLPAAFEVKYIEPADVADVQLVDELWNPDGTVKEPNAVKLDLSLGQMKSVRVSARPMLVTADGTRAAGRVTATSSSRDVLDVLDFATTTVLDFTGRKPGDATVTLGFDGRTWQVPAIVRP